jgi:rhodanese-related sulfurtransferase
LAVAQEIPREELREKVERGDGFVLVDVLGEQYYRHSHLPGAINLPLEEIERAPDALPDRDADVVVYCMSPI